MVRAAWTPSRKPDRVDQVTNQRVWLRPLGLLAGEGARDAENERVAFYLAGGACAFTSVEIIYDVEPGTEPRRSLVSVRDLLGTRETSIMRALDRVTGQRKPICGLDMDRTHIMGIVNATPDSFSDGGQLASAQAAIDHARTLAGEGAAIIDIGGESTRPGAAPVSIDEELARTVPVINGLKDLDAVISIDTRNPAVMEAAVRDGAGIINDVTALSHKPDSLAPAAKLGVPVCLMHAQGTPETMQDNPTYGDVVFDVLDYLQSRIDAAIAAGIHRDQIIVDPGIGFGKTVTHNLEIMNNLAMFHNLGVPVLLGASRKSFIGAVAGEQDPKRRLPGSLTAALTAAGAGIQFVRVHDVGETRQALKLWEQMVVLNE